MKKIFATFTITILLFVPILLVSQTYSYNPLLSRGLDLVGSGSSSPSGITISGTDPIVVTGGGGLTPAISATIASNAEALAATSNVVLMTPLRTKELFDAHALPATTGLNGVFLSFVDGAVGWVYKLIIPPSGDQIIDNVADSITIDRSVVNVTPNGAYTLTSTPSMSAGADGQSACVRNNGVGILTLQDRDTLTGSGLNLVGATSLAISPGEVFCFLSNSSYWELTGRVGSSSSTNRAMFSFSSNTANSPSNTTPGFIAISGYNSSSATSDTTRHTVMPYTGTLRDLSISLGTSQSPSITQTCSIAVNGTIPGSSLSVTIPVSSGTEDDFHDNTNTVAVTKGDVVSLTCVGSGTGTNANLASGSVTLVY